MSSDRPKRTPTRDLTPDQKRAKRRRRKMSWLLRTGGPPRRNPLMLAKDYAALREQKDQMVNLLSTTEGARVKPLLDAVKSLVRAKKKIRRRLFEREPRIG